MASQVQIPFEGVILQEHSAPISCPTPNFAKGSSVKRSGIRAAPLYVVAVPGSKWESWSNKPEDADDSLTVRKTLGTTRRFDSLYFLVGPPRVYRWAPCRRLCNLSFHLSYASLNLGSSGFKARALRNAASTWVAGSRSHSSVRARSKFNHASRMGSVVSWRARCKSSTTSWLSLFFVDKSALRYNAPASSFLV